MPVSKKRKPKYNKKSAPPYQKTAIATGVTPAATGKSAGSPKKKLSKQQIIIYVISAVVILSMAISYLVGNSGSSGRGAPAPTSASTVTTPDQGSSADQAAPSTETPATQ